MSQPKEHSNTSAENETKRRWRIPPPLLRDVEAPGPEGLYVLEDFPTEQGMVLWKSLRSVLLWAQVEPEDRGELFGEGAAERRQAEILSSVPEGEGKLREALEELLPILSRPDGADAEAVGLACGRISAWAEAKAAPRTALEFMQAAALACPANGRFALAVGRQARDLTQYARAESWLYRAVGLSRQVDDWQTYIRAYLCHGNMMLRRGALPAARSSFVKARRRATRQGLREFEAMSHHDLFALEIHAGNFDGALDSAKQAASAYGPNHQSFPRFAHDVAFFWMQHGEYEHALEVFSETLKQVDAGDRATVLGSLARAAAGVGNRERFAWAVEELEQVPDGPGVAEAWVEAARGGILMGDHADAERAARFAERVARQRGEGQVRFMAESVLEEAEAEARAVEARRAATVASPDRARQREAMATELLASLRAAPGPR